MSNAVWRWLASFVIAAGFLASGPVSAIETITYFHNDIAGTPVLATDATGEVVWKENYTPFGDKLIRDPASTENDLWYTGKPHDDATGLTYMGARYYDPVLGRFMGVDPKDVEPQVIHSFNRYCYANNNPYKYLDPDGREPVFIGAFKHGQTLNGAVQASAPTHAALGVTAASLGVLAGAEYSVCCGQVILDSNLGPHAASASLASGVW